MALWASGLGVRRKRRWVFRDLAIGLQAGEVVRLSGPPGSGKSSLLRILAGCAAPTSGIVRHRPPIISYVPARFTAPPLESTELFLRRLARLRGFSESEGFRRTNELIDKFSLRNVVDAPAAELIEDELHKLAFAQTLLERPSLLILDEAWSGTGTAALRVTAAEMKKLAEHGCVVLFTDRDWKLRGLELDQHLSLAGGILHSISHERAPNERPTMRIEVQGQGQPFERATGIIDYRLHPQGITVVSDYDHTNDVLRVALQSGWQVRRVEPYE
jgi:ABC-type transport system involved in cytochrome c biogenesis ATPase subunit